jgi:predicted amidohydrolase
MMVCVKSWILLLVTIAAHAADFQFAALTLTPEPWNKAANYAKFEKFAREAKSRGATVIVAPEGFLEGYVGNQGRTPNLDPVRYLDVAEPLDGPWLQKVKSLAMELNAHLMLGFAERRGKEVFNSVVMFSPSGERLIHYSKTHTMNDEPFNTKGDVFPVVETPFGKVGTLICFDRQVPETARILALKGARILLVPAWGSSSEMNDVMMRVRAYENNVWLAFVHPDRALIIDPSGKIVAQNTAKGDQVVITQISIPEVAKPGLLRFRRPGLYGELVK